MTIALTSRAKRLGLQHLVRHTTLITFAATEARETEQWLADSLRTVRPDLSDKRLAAFLLFEATSQDGDATKGDKRPWKPLIAARHLFGLGNYDYDTPNQPLSTNGHSLKQYVAQYNDDVKRREPLKTIDPLGPKSWTFRQILASGESGLNEVRGAFLPGEAPAEAVADALRVEAERILSTYDGPALGRMLAHWEARSGQELQRRADESLAPPTEHATNPPRVASIPGLDDPDFVRILDRRVTSFTHASGMQVFEHNTRVIQVTASSLQRIVVPRLSRSNASGPPRLINTGETSVRAIHVNDETIRGVAGYRWDLEITFPPTSASNTRTLEWISVIDLPDNWRASNGWHAMWIQSSHRVLRAEMLVRFDPDDLPIAVDAFSDVYEGHIDTRTFDEANLKRDVLSASHHTAEESWDDLRPGRAYGLAVSWTPSSAGR